MSYYDQPNRTVSDSVTAGNNTGGLTVTLDAVSGRPFVNFYYDVTADAVITVEYRYKLDDGTFTPWIELESLDTSAADTDNEGSSQYPWQSFDSIRATTDTTGVGVEFILSVGE